MTHLFLNFPSKTWDLNVGSISNCAGLCWIYFLNDLFIFRDVSRITNKHRSKIIYWYISINSYFDLEVISTSCCDSILMEMFWFGIILAKHRIGRWVREQKYCKYNSLWSHSKNLLSPCVLEVLHLVSQIHPIFLFGATDLSIAITISAWVEI